MTDFQPYSVVGFDLDNTLFDQTEYEFEIFKEIAKTVESLYQLKSDTYFKALQQVYYSGSKEHSFDQAMLKCTRVLPLNWEETMKVHILPLYRSHVPTQLTLFETSLPLLEILKKSNKKLLLITNGRVETQNAKIDTLGLRAYFDLILISDSYVPLARKPDTKMFEDALIYFNISSEEMIYVGDDLVRDKASENIGIKFLNIETLKTNDA